MSHDFLSRRIVQEILEIARHRGDFVLFPSGEIYNCRDPEPERIVPAGFSSEGIRLHYYHVGVSTRPVRRELRPVFTRIARPRPDPAALQDHTGDPCGRREP